MFYKDLRSSEGDEISFIILHYTFSVHTYHPASQICLPRPTGRSGTVPDKRSTLHYDWTLKLECAASFSLYFIMFPSSRPRQGHTLKNIFTMLSVFIVAAVFLQLSYTLRTHRDIVYRAPKAPSPVIPLDVFQVEAPLRESYDGAACKQVILQHNFAASYGSPYVGMSPQPSANYLS